MNVRTADNPDSNDRRPPSMGAVAEGADSNDQPKIRKAVTGGVAQAC